MKILEITEFSAGICGVWARVKQESEQLAKQGHSVTVFSSNIEKGTEKIAPPKQTINNIIIQRFPAKKYPSSKGVHHFNFTKELIKLKPDRVITHLPHPHSFKALKICKKLNIPCYLVPHSPFAVKRNFLLSILTKIYYAFKVKPKINQFTKIISITNWEKPYLRKLGVPEEKIVYIPNSIPDKFFNQKIKLFNAKKILFLGRIAPVKNLETPIAVIRNYQKNISFEIIGPIEKEYESITHLKSNKIKFSKPIYNLDEKIKKLQEADIFILPSTREAMPQALIEAMALGKIVISSDTLGAKDIISDKENGFLFKIGDKKNLKQKLDYIFSLFPEKINNIQKNARKSVEIFKSSSIIKKLNNLLK